MCNKHLLNIFSMPVIFQNDDLYPCNALTWKIKFIARPRSGSYSAVMMWVYRGLDSYFVVPSSLAFSSGSVQQLMEHTRSLYNPRPWQHIHSQTSQLVQSISEHWTLQFVCLDRLFLHKTACFCISFLFSGYLLCLTDVHIKKFENLVQHIKFNCTLSVLFSFLFYTSHICIQYL